MSTLGILSKLDYIIEAKIKKPKQQTDKTKLMANASEFSVAISQTKVGHSFILPLLCSLQVANGPLIFYITDGSKKTKITG